MADMDRDIPFECEGRPEVFGPRVSAERARATVRYQNKWHAPVDRLWDVDPIVNGTISTVVKGLPVEDEDLSRGRVSESKQNEQLEDDSCSHAPHNATASLRLQLSTAQRDDPSGSLAEQF